VSHIISIKTGGEDPKQQVNLIQLIQLVLFEVRLIVETSNIWSAGGEGLRIRLSTILFSTSGSGDVKSTPMPLGPLEPLLQATWCAGCCQNGAKMELLRFKDFDHGHEYPLVN